MCLPRSIRATLDLQHHLRDASDLHANWQQPGGVMEGFGAAVLRLCTDRGLSLRALAQLAHLDPAHLSRVVAGTRPPSRMLAEAVDSALGGGGRLAELVPVVDRRSVDAGVRESTRLAHLLDDAGTLDGDDIRTEADRLAVAYLSNPAGAMHVEASRARAAAGRALRSARRPGQAADLTVAVGRLSGVLAYAALDLGDATAAMVHADLTYRCGRKSGDDGLVAWARGTQSLIARFAADYPAALRYALGGLEYAPGGSGRARLLCGVAQCYANLGDAREADAALAEADRDRDRSQSDGIGLFGFSQAKQLYYAGSSLIWLPGDDHARRALVSAEDAITTWAGGPADERSHDDEALAHVYAATAAAQLHDLDLVVDHLAPILDLPVDRRISWIRKRMVRVAEILTQPPYAGQSVAVETIKRIRDYR